MAPRFNVYWSKSIDFRTFDISVPKFGFVDRGPLDLAPVIDTLYGPVVFEDEIRMTQTVGARFADVFYGNGLTRSGQTLTGGDIGMFVDYSGNGAQRGYIEPLLIPFSVTQLNSVIDSPGTADDKAFLRLMLSGDDAVELSGGPTGTVTDDYVFTANGHDTIYGNKGNDTLLGEAGFDQINGGAGADHLYGGTSQDTLNGGGGNDRLFGGKSRDVLDGGSGHDLLTSGAGGGNLYGGSGADTIIGGADAESIVGGNGNDRIIGGGGDDSLYGDEIFGGVAGADKFVFRKNAGRDNIQDFQDGIDKIVIEAPGGTNVGSFVKTNLSGGGGCIISIAALNIEITLFGVSKNQISLADDFILVAL